MATSDRQAKAFCKEMLAVCEEVSGDPDPSGEVFGFFLGLLVGARLPSSLPTFIEAARESSAAGPAIVREMEPYAERIVRAYIEAPRRAAPGAPAAEGGE